MAILTDDQPDSINGSSSEDQADPTAIKQLLASIDDAINKVDAIEYFATKKISSDQLKQELIPVLQAAKKQVFEIEYINKNLDAVRNQIIDPVNKIIQRSSEPSLKLSKWGLWIGIVGIVVPLLSVLFGQLIPAIKGLDSQESKPNQSTTLNITGANDLGELETIFYGTADIVASSEVHSQSVEIIFKSESALQVSSKVDKEQIGRIKSELSDLLKKAKSVGPDLDLISRIVYARILCSVGLDNWNEVLQLAQTPISKKLNGTAYGSACAIYRAEAYNKLGAVNEALTVYKQLTNLGEPNSLLIILSPDNRKMEPVKTIVARRMNDIELQLTISNSLFWVLDSKKSDRDKSLANMLQAKGYKVVAKGGWATEFLYPYLYYRNKELRQSGALRLIKAQIGEPDLKVQFWSESSGFTIKRIFTENQQLDFLIIL